MTLIVPTPYQWFSKWANTRWNHRGPEYEELKEEFAERLLKVAIKATPTIAGRVRWKEVSTPISTGHFCAKPGGAGYGLAHTPARFQQRWLRPSTPIKGLYLVGQDIVTVGVGAAMMSSILATTLILRRNMMSTIMRH